MPSGVKILSLLPAPVRSIYSRNSPGTFSSSGKNKQGTKGKLFVPTTLVRRRVIGHVISSLSLSPGPHPGFEGLPTSQTRGLTGLCERNRNNNKSRSFRLCSLFPVYPLVVDRPQLGLPIEQQTYEGLFRCAFIRILLLRTSL